MEELTGMVVNLELEVVMVEVMQCDLILLTYINDLTLMWSSIDFTSFAIIALNCPYFYQ